MPPCRLARPGSLTSRVPISWTQPDPARWSRPRSPRWGRPAAHAPSRLHGRAGVPGKRRSAGQRQDHPTSHVSVRSRSWRPAQRWSVSAWPSALCGIGRQELGGQERADHQRPGAGDGGLAWMVMEPASQPLHGLDQAEREGKPASARRRSVRGSLKPARTPAVEQVPSGIEGVLTAPIPAVLAAQVGWVVQPVRSGRGSDAGWNDQ